MRTRFVTPFLVTLLFTSMTAMADDLQVDSAWARATPPGGGHGAGYLNIHNHSNETQRLVGATFAPADHVEVHRSTEQDGMSRMEHMRDGVEIEPHGTLNLQPGGYHLMLMKLESPLVEGEEHPLTLIFEPAGEVETTLNVRSRDSDGHSGGHEHHHHH